MVESTHRPIYTDISKVIIQYEEEENASSENVLKTSEQIKAHGKKISKQGKKLTIFTANGSHGKPLIDRLVGDGN